MSKQANEAINVSRRNFLKRTTTYTTTAAVGTVAMTASPKAEAAFITLAKTYGELMGLACRPPTIMAYEVAAEFIAEQFGSMNTGSMNSYISGTDRFVQLKTEIDKTNIARHSEPSPKMCAFQELGLEQQRYLYRDAEIANEFAKTPPTTKFSVYDDYLDAGLLARHNTHTENLSAEKRNQLAHGFKNLGHSQTFRGDYDTPVPSEKLTASNEARRILSYQAHSVVSSSLLTDSRHASYLQNLETFDSDEWRESMASSASDTGLFAEATRQLGQACYLSHQLLLAEEQLLIMETLKGLNSLAKLQESSNQ